RSWPELSALSLSYAHPRSRRAYPTRRSSDLQLHPLEGHAVERDAATGHGRERGGEARLVERFRARPLLGVDLHERDAILRRRAVPEASALEPCRRAREAGHERGRVRGEKALGARVVGGRELALLSGGRCREGRG